MNSLCRKECDLEFRLANLVISPPMGTMYPTERSHYHCNCICLTTILAIHLDSKTLSGLGLWELFFLSCHCCAACQHQQGRHHPSTIVLHNLFQFIVVRFYVNAYLCNFCCKDTHYYLNIGVKSDFLGVKKYVRT